MHVIKAGSSRRTRTTDEAELLSRATGRMQAQKLIDLIDESAPEEGVVDVHEIEAKFADGSRRIPLVDNAAVCAVVEGTADTTRRMSAVDLDAAVVATIEDVADTTRRMSAVQASELTALITPDVPIARANVVRTSALAAPVADEPSPVVVKFRAPTVRPALELPLPAPLEVEIDAEPPAIDAPIPAARRSSKAWMIGALFAFAAAAAGLAAVVLS